MSEKISQKPSFGKRLLAAGTIAGTVALGTTACGAEPRHGTISNEHVPVASDIRYSKDGMTGIQQFGITGTYTNEGNARGFTSQVLVACEAIPSWDEDGYPTTDIRLTETAYTLLGKGVMKDVIDHKTITVDTYPLSCATYFPTVDREQLARDYMEVSLNDVNRVIMGDGDWVESVGIDPVKASQAILENAEAGNCPFQTACPLG